MKVQCSNKDGLLGQHVSVMEDSELVDQCPIANEGFVHKFGLLKPENRLQPHVSQYKSLDTGKVCKSVNCWAISLSLESLEINSVWPI